MAIELSPLHPTLGAEVRGIDITRPVIPEIFAEIDAAFSRYAVLVFPGQPVTDEQQLAFSRLFGPLEVNLNYAGAKMRLRPDIADISNLDGEGRVRAYVGGVNYADSYRYVAFPMGLFVLAFALFFFAGTWLRRRLGTS